jgi:hypothetical protein
MYFYRIDENEVLSKHKFYSNGTLITELNDNNETTTHTLTSNEEITCWFDNTYPYSLHGNTTYKPVFSLDVIYRSGNHGKVYIDISTDGITWSGIYESTRTNASGTIRETLSQTFLDNSSGCYGMRIRANSISEGTFLPRIVQAHFSPITKYIETLDDYIEISQYNYFGSINHYVPEELQDYETQKEVYIHSYDYNTQGVATPTYIKNLSPNTILNTIAYLPESLYTEETLRKDGAAFCDKFAISLDGTTWKYSGEILEIGTLASGETKELFIASNFGSTHYWNTSFLNATEKTNNFYGRLCVEGDVDMSEPIYTPDDETGLEYWFSMNKLSENTPSGWTDGTYMSYLPNMASGREDRYFSVGSGMPKARYFTTYAQFLTEPPPAPPDAGNPYQVYISSGTIGIGYPFNDSSFTVIISSKTEDKYMDGSYYPSEMYVWHTYGVGNINLRSVQLRALHYGTPPSTNVAIQAYTGRTFGIGNTVENTINTPVAGNLTTYSGSYNTMVIRYGGSPLFDFYVNGVFKGSGTNPFDTVSGTWRIFDNFVGKAKDLLIYNTCLDDSAITRITNYLAENS